MEGTSADTKAGYVYVCFGNVKGSDVQQLHFFLSEDGLNWTALNGFPPLFEVGTDYADDIETVGTHNYAVKAGTDIKSTTSGDASVLFPFEGNDQGVRDPYLIRGARKEDSGGVDPGNRPEYNGIQVRRQSEQQFRRKLGNDVNCRKYKTFRI